MHKYRYYPRGDACTYTCVDTIPEILLVYMNTHTCTDTIYVYWLCACVDTFCFVGMLPPTVYRIEEVTMTACARVGGWLQQPSQATLHLVLSEGVMGAAKKRAILLEPTDKAFMPVHASWVEVRLWCPVCWLFQWK